MRIAARITDIKTSDELAALRGEVAAGAVADQFKAAVDAYDSRSGAQDSAVLRTVFTGVEDYLRNGGHPAMAAVIESALAVAH